MPALIGFSPLGWIVGAGLAVPLLATASLFASTSTPGSATIARLILLIGGSAAVGVGASVAARRRHLALGISSSALGEVAIAAGSFLAAASLFLLLLSTGTAIEYNIVQSGAEDRQFDPMRYAALSLAVFGFLAGLMTAAWFARPRSTAQTISVVGVALGWGVSTVLMGLLIFYVRYVAVGLLGLLPLPSLLAKPAAEALAGSFSALFPGLLSEKLLLSYSHPYVRSNRT